MANMETQRVATNEIWAIGALWTPVRPNEYEAKHRDTILRVSFGPNKVGIYEWRWIAHTPTPATGLKYTRWEAMEAAVRATEVDR